MAFGDLGRGKFPDHDFFAGEAVVAGGQFVIELLAGAGFAAAILEDGIDRCAEGRAEVFGEARVLAPAHAFKTEDVAETVTQ